MPTRRKLDRPNRIRYIYLPDQIYTRTMYYKVACIFVVSIISVVT